VGPAIFATGGYNVDSGAYQQEAYVYNLTTRKYCQLLYLPQPLSGHAQVEWNGEIYLIGGSYASKDAIDSVYSFDGRQYTVRPSLNYARANHTATTIANTAVVVVGGSGQAGRKVEFLDGYSVTEGPEMLYAREKPALVYLQKRYLWAIGGDKESNGQSSEYIDFSNPSNGWVEGPSLLAAKRGAAAIAVGEYGQDILVCGGYNAAGVPNVTACERYLSAEQKWVPTFNMQFARADFIIFPSEKEDLMAVDGDVETSEKFEATNQKWSKLDFTIAMPNEWMDPRLVYAENVDVQCRKWI